MVLTSNLGAAEAASRSKRGIGFGKSDTDRAAAACDAVIAAARAALPPEFYNRIDEIIAFAPLARTEVAEVARRLLGQLDRALDAAHGIHLDVDEQAVEALLDAGGYDPELGARPMKRTIARLVEAPIADLILRKELTHDDVVLVSADGGKIVVDTVRHFSQLPS
jgi:ATP-dependent Clp protease ATP-binding subunit ClpC